MRLPKRLGRRARLAFPSRPCSPFRQAFFRLECSSLSAPNSHLKHRPGRDLSAEPGVTPGKPRRHVASSRDAGDTQIHSRLSLDWISPEEDLKFGECPMGKPWHPFRARNKDLYPRDSNPRLSPTVLSARIMSIPNWRFQDGFVPKTRQACDSGGYSCALV